MFVAKAILRTQYNFILQKTVKVIDDKPQPLPNGEQHSKRNEKLNLPPNQPKVNDLPKVTKKENDHSLIEQTKRDCYQ